jgi:hypothetical protein
MSSNGGVMNVAFVIRSDPAPLLPPHLICPDGQQQAGAGVMMPRGGVEKKMTKGKKSSYRHLLYLFFSSIFLTRFFGRFVTRGVQNHEKQFFRKNTSGLITKNVFFFPPFPPPSPPSVVLFDFFLVAFLGVFRNKGSSKTR